MQRELTTLAKQLANDTGVEIVARFLDHVLPLATPGGTTVALVTVVDPRVAVAATSVDLRLGSQTGETLVETVRSVAEEELEKLADELRESGVDVATHVLVDPHAARRILTYAEEEKIDLIALSTHRRGLVGRLFVGATADKIVRGAHCPVLVA